MNIVLVCHWSIGGRQVLRSLRAMGASVYLISDAWSASLRYSSSCVPLHDVADLSQADPGPIGDAINGLHRRAPVDCVMGSDLEGLLLIDRIRNAIPVPVYPMAPAPLLNRLNNKWRFCRLCRLLGIDVPNSMHLKQKPHDPNVIASKIGFPMVIKPTALQGQRGILYIATVQQLIDEFFTADYPYQDVIAQEFIPGKDWGISVFARDGHIFKWTTFLCPDYVSAVFMDNDELLDKVRRIIETTGFTGVANFDARLDARTGTIKMFECNPRFFLRLSAARLCGLDFVKAGLQPDQTERSGIAGYYARWRDLISPAGMGALMRGAWRPRVFARDLFETLIDPMPILVRGLSTTEEREALQAWRKVAPAQVGAVEDGDRHGGEDDAGRVDRNGRPADSVASAKVLV